MKYKKITKCNKAMPVSVRGNLMLSETQWMHMDVSLMHLHDTLVWNGSDK